MKGLIKDVDEAKTEGGVKGSNRIGFAELGGGVSDSEIYSKYEVDVDKNATGKADKQKLSQRNFRSSDFLEHFKQEKTVPRENISDSEIKKMPKDYDPYKKVKQFLNSEQEQTERRAQRRRTLSVKERALLLKEDFQAAEQSSNPKLALKTQSFMKKLSDQSKKLLMTSNRFVQTNKKVDDISYTPTEQIYEDRLKNERYHFFSLKQKKLYKGEIRYPLGFRASQINQELSEFANMYSQRKAGMEEEDQNPIAEPEEKKTEKEKLLFKIEEMREKIEQRKKKRVIEDWIPNRVLCIRFKVQQPKKKAVMRKQRKFDFEKDIMPVIERDLKQGARKRMIEEERELEKRMVEEEEKLRDEGVVMPDENQIDFVKPEKDLFDSIFNDDDSDED